MFSKATANFVQQIDPDGSLIPMSRVNDSHKLVPMGLVVKRSSNWFWQRPKYQPTDFTLSDLLQGDEVLNPGVSEKEFLTYKGMFGDKLCGKLDTEAGSVSLTLEGQGSSKLQSSFGKLKKEDLDVKKLLNDSSSRLVDMEHVLVQQLEKQAEVLAVVKERILTVDSCSVTQTKKKQFVLQGVLGLMSSFNVCVKNRNNIEVDSDVSLEIPPGTVIAYSILELEIKKNGHYELCLQPGTIGGIEADSHLVSWTSDDSLNLVDGKYNGSQEVDLSALAELPCSARCALFKSIHETLGDRSALSYLQCVLEDLCSGERLETDMHEELSESQRKPVSANLDQAGQQCGVPAHLKAAHLLVSAMEELPDETLSLLSESSPDFLEAFDTLMCQLKETSKPLSIQCLPVPLQDNQPFQLAEQLLSSTNVLLKRDADRLWMESGKEDRVLLLVLCLSIQGLSLLCKGLK